MWQVKIEENAYDGAIAIFILTFPFVRFLHERLGGDDGRGRGLGLVVRSIPIRHGETDPEDEETERKE